MANQAPPQPSRQLTPAQARNNDLTASLMDRKQKIADLIPPAMQVNADYLIARALFTFQRTAGLHKCTLASFVACVLQGAECGLPVDGKLGYAVPFNVKKKDANGQEYWEDVAQFIPGYRGMVVVGKRAGVIKDADVDLVCANDKFKMWRDDQGQHVQHEPAIGDRGAVKGAYASLRMPGGYYKYEFMDVGELNKIRERSKAKDKGPWVSDTNEMYKKTVIRRAMKMEEADPLMEKVTRASDFEFENDDEGPKLPAPKSLDELTDKLTGAATPAAGLPAPATADPEFDIPAETQADTREPAPAASKAKGKKKTQQPQRAAGSAVPPAKSAAAAAQSTQEPVSGEVVDEEEEPDDAAVDEEEGVGRRPRPGWVQETVTFIRETADHPAARRAYDAACSPHECQYDLTPAESALVSDAWQDRLNRLGRESRQPGKKGGQGRLVE